MGQAAPGFDEAGLGLQAKDSAGCVAQGSIHAGAFTASDRAPVRTIQCVGVLAQAVVNAPVAASECPDVSWAAFCAAGVRR